MMFIMILLVNPNIFKLLLPEQCEAAKRKLSAAPSSTQNPREFDYDIAKFLYVFPTAPRYL
jgi:hypothetical protein